MTAVALNSPVGSGRSEDEDEDEEDEDEAVDEENDEDEEAVVVVVVEMGKREVDEKVGVKEDMGSLELWICMLVWLEKWNCCWRGSRTLRSWSLAWWG